MAEAGRGFLGGLEPREDWEGCEEGGAKEVLLLLSEVMLPKEKMEDILFADFSISLVADCFQNQAALPLDGEHYMDECIGFPSVGRNDSCVGGAWQLHGCAGL